MASPPCKCQGKVKLYYVRDRIQRNEIPIQYLHRGARVLVLNEFKSSKGWLKSFGDCLIEGKSITEIYKGKVSVSRFNQSTKRLKDFARGVQEYNANDILSSFHKLIKPLNNPRW